MKNIISLLPSGTEIVCKLGFENSLVGISHECDFPESISKLPICSELKSNIDDYVLNSSDQDEKNYYSKEAMKNHSQLKIALQGPSGTSGLFTESKLQTLDQLIAETIRDIRKK